MCLCCVCVFFFFKQKTAYEMRISDWSSDVCSSDLEVGVDDDGAALVQLDAEFVQAQPGGQRPSADRQQHHVGGQLGGVAALDRLHAQRDTGLAGLGTGDLGRQLELDALLLQHALEALGGVGIGARKSVV